MKSDPSDYQLVAPRHLHAVIALLAREPGVWQPIAGGTDIMVLYGAGHLAHRKFVNICSLPELRSIRESAYELEIGAACTYTDIRNNAVIENEFPMLASAASWTGGIANQNRGTLGGNIANASPAADSPPALLAYDADILLTSLRGERRIPYRTFHLAYKKTAMAPDELIRAICLPRKFSAHIHHARKVGARQAQAIAKVSIAATGRVVKGAIAEARVAIGSVAPMPLRLIKLEAALIGQSPATFPQAELRRLLGEEIAPITDIRSTSQYRNVVAANLVAEFLQRLQSPPKNRINEYVSNEALARWNDTTPGEASAGILPCCGSEAWADAMTSARPFASTSSLLETARRIWQALPAEAWLQAFLSHPRIGETKAAPTATARSQEWSTQEQHQVAKSSEPVKLALAEANRQYEQQFGRIFIVCATGKSPYEILEILQRRLQNDAATEWREAAAQQQEITQLRLKKWLNE